MFPFGKRLGTNIHTYISCLLVLVFRNMAPQDFRKLNRFTQMKQLLVAYTIILILGSSELWHYLKLKERLSNGDI